jgi:hypothetical protein
MKHKNRLGVQKINGSGFFSQEMLNGMAEDLLAFERHCPPEGKEQTRAIEAQMVCLKKNIYVHRRMIDSIVSAQPLTKATVRELLFDDISPEFEVL